MRNDDDTASPPSWRRQVADVLGCHMATKAVGTTLFISVFFVAYFHLLKNPSYPATVMPLTLLDGIIPVQPLTLPLYLSLWLYVSLPPALLASRQELFRYGLAIGVTCLIGLLVFYFWPTRVPVTDVDWSRYPGIAFLKGVDASGNAFPSLHVATAVFSAIWLHRLLRRYGAPTTYSVINSLWCLGIVYSTLATRQHVAVDVLAGFVLGGVVAYLSLRGAVLDDRPPRGNGGVGK